MKSRALNLHPMAAVAAIGSVLAFAQMTEAKVVYTRVNVTVSGNGSIGIDLNHDGITDFVLRSNARTTVCGNRGGLAGSTRMVPTTGDGIVVSQLDFAAVLASGVPIDDTATFYKATSVVTQFHLCEDQTIKVSGYLGLEFQINGQTHYGWALVKIDAFFGTTGGSMSTTLLSFAYETIPGQTINTGQKSEDAYNPDTGPDSATP